jgi:hypothetical protein
MRKLNLTKYKVPAKTPTGEERQIDYDVKESLVELLFSPTMKLGGTQLLKSQQVAEKILDAEDSVLLEDEEYNLIQKSVENFQGFGRREVELVKRVLEAEKVDVNKESKGAKKP